MGGFDVVTRSRRTLAAHIGLVPGRRAGHLPDASHNLGFTPSLTGQNSTPGCVRCLVEAPDART